jgi:hypothetical protein
MLTTWYPPFAKVDTNLADKRLSLGRYSSLTDAVCFLRFVILSVVEEKYIYIDGGKTTRLETTRKTYTYVGIDC